MYCALHLPLLKLYKFNHPCEYLILQLWRHCCWAQCLAHRAPAGRSEFNKATVVQNGTERSAGVDSGELKAWLSSGGFWLWKWSHGSGTPAPPHTPHEAPSHLCAVEPRGRQLLPLIITPNGWIHFLLTSSSWHNIIPMVHRPETPSSRLRSFFIQAPLCPMAIAGVQLSITAVKFGCNN